MSSTEQDLHCFQTNQLTLYKMSQLSVSDMPSISFSICGKCCPNFETWLYRHRHITIIIGCVIYLPLLFVLEMVWFITLILTIIINLFVIIFCCNWKPHRRIFGMSLPRDKNKYGIMLETAQPRSTIQSDTPSPDTKDGNAKDITLTIPNTETKTEISILSFNVFAYYDKFWARYPLLIKSLTESEADIVCIQECITTKVWDFGTLQTLKQINHSYNGFYISHIEMFKNYYEILFRYSFCWPIISELQMILQIYFSAPFWQDLTWKAVLGGNWIARYGYAILTGCGNHYGNAIAFNHNRKLYYKSFIMLPGMRSAIRSLYQENDKKIWVVNTHFSCEEEQNSFYATDPDQSGDENEHEMAIGAKQADIMLKWIQDGNDNIAQSDYVIICGDFNADPKTDVYQFMIEHGYKSIMFEKYDKEKLTYNSGTWTCNTEAHEHLITTYDYIWIKNCNDDELNIEINDCKLIGQDYVIQDDQTQINASDHLGIFVKLTL